MLTITPSLTDLSVDTQAFYRKAVQLLNAHDIPFLVGGAYALAHYTGIVRHTKDFDVFTTPADARRALTAFADAGYRTEMTFAHWLGKAFHGEDFVDVIFSSGNGVAKVDDLWFAHSVPATFLGEPLRLCPAEEIIWSKAFVCERERFDNADINHLLLHRAADLDWPRLLARFGSYWRVLYMHLILFGFVYPSERASIPPWVMDDLAARLKAEADAPPPGRRLCQGTLLSRVQYVIDLDEWGFADARLDAASGMTPQQTDAWTDAGLREQKK